MDGDEVKARSWEQVEFNCLLILGAGSDPEESLTIALTREDFALACFGVQLAVRLFPELSDVAERFLVKVYELSQAQDFLDWRNSPEMKQTMDELFGLDDPGDELLGGA